jgi:hypothetical protein
MADSLEDILARKKTSATGDHSLEDILAMKTARKETYPLPPSGPQPLPKEGTSAFSARQPIFDVGEAIAEFAADAYATGKLGSVGEAIGKRILTKFPRAGGFLGKMAGYTGGGVLGQYARGEEPNIKTSAAGALFGASSEKLLQGVGGALARGGKVPRAVVKETLEQPTVGRVGEMFGGAEPQQFLEETKRVGEGVKTALRTKSAGRVEAERMIKVADQLVPHGVDAGPIKQRILSMKNPNATFGQAKMLNDQLDEMAASIPDRVSYSKLDNLVRELGEPIKSQLGNIEMRLPVQTRKRILDFTRAYRNKELPGAEEPFKRSEKYISATKDLYKRIFDTKGNMRPQAPNTWRKAIQDPQVMEALTKFDQTTGGQYGATQKGMELARKAYWTPDDGETAEGLLLAGIGWFGRASLFLGRGAGKTAIAVSRPVGGASSVAARMAFETAMNPENNP